MGKILTPKHIAVYKRRGKVMVSDQRIIELCDSHEALRELVADLAGSLKDFGADQTERRGSMHRQAAEALDMADKVREHAHEDG